MGVLNNEKVAAREVDLTPRPAYPLAATPVPPAALLQHAMNSGADLDRLERLMDLQDRWMGQEAERAYTEAMLGFKLKAPRIEKNKTADFTTTKGRTVYGFSDLANVVEAVVILLAENGFSHSWVPDQSVTGKLTITCVLTHRAGHKESRTLTASHDESGGKNAIQGLGSTASYLERYTLLMACGLAVADGSDDDGASAQPEAKPTEAPKHSIVGPQFDRALAAIKAGQYSPAEMRGYYALDEKQAARLAELEKEMAQ